MTKEFEKIVKFKINENDEKIFNSKVENYDKIVQLIENFNFDKYQEYLDDDYMKYSNTISLNFSDLREDKSKSCDKEELKRITSCTVKFENEYVSLKNEK